MVLDSLDDSDEARLKGRCCYFSTIFRKRLFHFPYPHPGSSGEAHRDGLRIAGLITRDRVLDWCPPAVLFYPIRSTICCIIGCRVGAPPTHAGVRVCGCALHTVAIVCTTQMITINK